MVEKLRSIALKPGFRLIQNQNYLLALAFFNCAVLMNYHEMIWKRPVIFCIVFIMVGFSFLNFRYWWAALATILINFILYCDNFPRLANHSNLELFACAVFIAVFFRKVMHSRFSLSPVLVSWLFRVSLVMVYFYTGFHKLNSDFFNPCVSCVNQINEQIYENFTGREIKLSEKWSYIFQYATLFVEIVLPWGLLWHHTRKFTAIALLSFHFYLSFAVFADFEAFAVFMILGCVLDFEKSTIRKSTINALKLYLFIALSAIFIKPLLQLSITDKSLVDFIHGSIFNIGVLVFFIVFFRQYKAKKDPIPANKLALPIIAALLISLWSMKTYVGLGNSANLTMFSNLVTEKSRGNHLLIDTKKTKIFNFEEDNVLILKAHDTLKRYELENYRFPMTEFRYTARLFSERYPNIKLNCTFVYKNDTLVIPDLRHSEYTTTEWWYHYLNFRKIQPEGPNACIW